MLKLKCLLCLEKSPPVETLIMSKIICKNYQEEVMELGKEMTNHLGISHSQAMQEMLTSNPVWNGFNIVKYFEDVNTLDPTKESKYEKEKEKMRDRLVEMVMYAAPDDEEEDLDEEDDEDLEDDCDDEDDEDGLDFDDEESEDEDEEEEESAKPIS